MSGRCSLDVNASATRFAMAHCNTVCACFGPVFSGKSLHRSNSIQTQLALFLATKKSEPDARLKLILFDCILIVA
jgi:hypothetical protein